MGEKNLLIIDDNAWDLMLTELAIKHELSTRWISAKISKTTSPMDWIRIIRESNFDAVIVDNRMHWMTWLAFSHLLRDHWNDIFILLVSWEVRLISQEDVVESWVNWLLEKNHDLDLYWVQLFEALSNVLS